MNTTLRAGRPLPFLIFTLLLTITRLPSVQAQGAAGLPIPDHIIVLIYENHSYSSIIGNSAAPYINALVTDTNCALFTQSYGLVHPSQPNYFDLFAGDNQGVTSDNVPAGYPFTTPNLAKQLVNAGKGFTTYSEDLPGTGFDGATSGNYARKHNPAANWMGTGTNQIATTTNQPFTAFPSSGSYSSLPTVAYVIPNLVNDMHNGSGAATITAGDAWMHANLDAYMHWALTNNSLLIITFDEDDGAHGNQIPTIFYGPMVKGGSYSEHIDHYNVLRTMEDMYTLPYAGNAATSVTIMDCWRHAATSVIPTAGMNAANGHISIFPNPSHGAIHLSSDTQLFDVHFCVYNSIGQIVASSIIEKLSAMNDLDINLPAGVYIYKLESSATSVVGRFLVD